MTRFLGTRGSISEIERNSEKLTVEWKITNFLTLSSKGGDCYSSPGFDFNSARWGLLLFSNGLKGNEPSGYVDLGLVREDKGPPMTIHFALSITGKEKVERRYESEYRFSEEDRTYGCINFLSRRVLKDYQPILMPDGVVTVRCIMKNIVHSPVKGVSSCKDTSSHTEGRFKESRPCASGSKSSNKQDASIQTDEEFEEALSHSSAKQETSTQTDNDLETVVPIQAHQSAEKQGCEKLHEDFSNLLASGEDSDVTVQVGDVEFKAHRAILSARCPVLSAMFRHDTEERATNRISVCDCEPEVFKQYLHFIYTGTVEPLSEKTVFGLYRIADKYLADDLKQNCLEHMKDSLSVQTFCDVLKLALTHGESDLLQLTIEFATKNLPLIICTVEWQNFLRDHPTEANEVLIKCICPQTKK